MPFNPYRPHRFPDPINRSRFPVNNPLPNTRVMPPSTMPPKAWGAPVNHNIAYPQHNIPAPTSQRAYVQQQQQCHDMSLKVRAPIRPTQRDTSYFQPCVTPEKQVVKDPWDEGKRYLIRNYNCLETDSTEAFKSDLKSTVSKEQDGLGLSFQDRGRSLDRSFYDEIAIDSLEGLVRLDDVEPWNFESTSPDRQSWSSLSASSGEAISDFPDFQDLPSLENMNSNIYSGLDMTFVTEDATPTLSHFGHGKKSSQLDCYSTQSEFQTWENSIHTRQSSMDSIPSSAVSTVSQGLSNSQCCTPSEDYPEFITQDLDFSFDSTSSLLSDNIFDMTHNDSHSYHMQPKQSSKSQYSCDDLFSASSFTAPLYQDKVATILPSSGHFDLFHSHGAVEDKCESHFADFAEVPNLFGPLQGEQLQPDAEDMKPEDKDLEPRVQDLRFEGDLYTPKYVRGHGNKREGWCGICKPGRWLVLKNSAFWYDKSFTHGISAASGMAFDAPKETRRMSGNPDVWEGLCGSCGDWIALISSKKKGTTWFRHAYKVSLLTSYFETTAN